MKVRDPVCGMTIDAERAAAQLRAGSETVYFCSTGCRDTYQRRSARPVP